MNKALIELLTYMLNKRYIGGKHKPERELINHRIKLLDREERKEFERDYKGLINEGLLIRLMKRTGKGYEWHSSLNPRMLSLVYEIIGEVK